MIRHKSKKVKVGAKTPIFLFGRMLWLVTAVSSGRFETIEGNTSGGSIVIRNGGAVCRKSYAIGTSSIAGFGRPAYDKQPAFTPSWVKSGENWYYMQPTGGLEGALYRSDENGAQYIWTV